MADTDASRRTSQVNKVVGLTEADKSRDQQALGAIKMHYVDLPTEGVDFCVQSATKALKALYKGDKTYFYEIAESIKKEVEAKYGGTWHVIVGNHFGSYVSYEIKSMVYFFVGPVGILIYKHG